MLKNHQVHMWKHAQGHSPVSSTCAFHVLPTMRQAEPGTIAQEPQCSASVPAPPRPATSMFSLIPPSVPQSSLGATQLCYLVKARDFSNERCYGVM